MRARVRPLFSLRGFSPVTRSPGMHAGRVVMLAVGGSTLVRVYPNKILDNATPDGRMQGLTARAGGARPPRSMLFGK